MDTFLGFLVIGGCVYWYFRAKAKKAEGIQQPLAVRASRTTSRSNARGEWRPTYDGPMFAQPGEKGSLFGYASYGETFKIEAPFAIIDFETSGFQPEDSRIIEVAVLKIDADGKVLQEYTTLINPGDGRVGRSDIHKISAAMVKKAPLLEEILGDVMEVLNSSVVVAHNAKFEENFLNAALREVGVKHPLIPTLDTLWLSRQVLDLPNYKLGTVIEEFGIDFADAHTALGDVRAMAQVLPEMLRKSQVITYPVDVARVPTFAKGTTPLPR